MRITFPNPLGPPITLDTSPVGQLVESAGNTSFGRWLGRKPHLKFLALIFGLLLLLGWRPRPPLPPSWKPEWEKERSIGQKVVSGKGGRFVKFDIPRYTGFNPQLQRIILHHHLAILGNRSMAYEPISVDNALWSFKFLRWPWRSAEVPLGGFIGSVTSGFEAGNQKAFPASYFRSVCVGLPQRTYQVRSPSQPDGDLELVGDGQARIHQLQVLLAGSDDSCVTFKGDVFDDVFFDSAGPIQLHESFIQSPLMKNFKFSTNVYRILNNVLPDLAPETIEYDLEGQRQSGKAGTWRHILALHIRRASAWEDVCEEKGGRAAPFVSWNKLPRLPGNENVPPPADMNEASRMGLYRAKCLPQTLDIIARARRLRKNHPLLRSVYILGDVDDAWMKELRMWLESDGWDQTWMGRNDVYRGWKEREVGVAVDMEVARRAGVFVGNGFSTTSSNIILLRSKDNLHPDLSQFW